MKLFLTLLFDCVFAAIFIIGAAILSKILVEEKESICYIGVVIVDIIVIASMCVAWLHLLGII